MTFNSKTAQAYLKALPPHWRDSGLARAYYLFTAGLAANATQAARQVISEYQMTGMVAR